MLFCINVEFRGLKLQVHFSQDVLFVGCDIVPQIMVAFCILLNMFHSALTSIKDISYFQNGLNHPCSLTSFYSKNEIVEDCHET